MIISEIQEQSRKPEELYFIIENIIPNGNFLELFGRKHNVRNGWITLGNEL